MLELLQNSDLEPDFDIEEDIGNKATMAKEEEQQQKEEVRLCSLAFINYETSKVRMQNPKDSFLFDW